MTRRTWVAFAAILCAAFLLRPRPLAGADDWLPISPDELKMTSEPKAPGAQAIYLYRQVDRDDQLNVVNNYIRVKVFTEEGRKQANVEILYFADDASIRNIKHKCMFQLIPVARRTVN